MNQSHYVLLFANVAYRHQTILYQNSLVCILRAHLLHTPDLFQYLLSRVISLATIKAVKQQAGLV